MSQTALHDDLREKARQIVADVLEVDTDELSDTSSFADDFDADSLLVIEMYSRFERDLRIKVPQEDIVELDNMTTVFEVIGRHSGAGAVRA
ncbi:phosphopantetheine-binding protein [Streptomyces sp. NPDC004232]|uniref:acyl carrier protein n=1 Tax=Streptomyces sp. NPDC004232 TaxID=3154454 RepID=UPI001D1B7ED2|nr:acyl carrier protein [Streptomyces sp. tea 10]